MAETHFINPESAVPFALTLFICHPAREQEHVLLSLHASEGFDDAMRILITLHDSNTFNNFHNIRQLTLPGQTGCNTKHQHVSAVTYRM